MTTKYLPLDIGLGNYVRYVDQKFGDPLLPPAERTRLEGKVVEAACLAYAHGLEGVGDDLISQLSSPDVRLAAQAATAQSVDADIE